MMIKTFLILILTILLLLFILVTFPVILLGDLFSFLIDKAGQKLMSITYHPSFGEKLDD